MLDKILNYGYAIAGILGSVLGATFGWWEVALVGVVYGVVSYVYQAHESGTKPPAA